MADFYRKIPGTLRARFRNGFGHLQDHGDLHGLLATSSAGTDAAPWEPTTLLSTKQSRVALEKRASNGLASWAHNLWLWQKGWSCPSDLFSLEPKSRVNTGSVCTCPMWRLAFHDMLQLKKNAISQSQLQMRHHPVNPGDPVQPRFAARSCCNDKALIGPNNTLAPWDLPATVSKSP